MFCCKVLLRWREIKSANLFPPSASSHWGLFNKELSSYFRRAHCCGLKATYIPKRWLSSRRRLVPEGCTWLAPGKAVILGKSLSLLVSYGLLHEEHAVFSLIPAYAVGCFDSFSNETQFLEILTPTSSRDMHVMAPHLPHK